MRRRRRSYNKRPETPRLEHPVQIECIGNVPAPFTVPIGNEAYLFAENGSGRKVTSVFIEEHVACFLARPEMYRAVGGRAA